MVEAYQDEDKGPAVKLPVLRSVKLALLWTAAVLARHWRFVGLIALAPALAVMASRVLPSPGVSILVAVVFVLAYCALIPLALVTHNEVLRGPSGLDAVTLGKGPGRALGYVLDLIVIFIFTALYMLLLGIGAALIGALIRAITIPGPLAALIVFLVFACAYLSWLGFFVRLMLRLPSRALGQPLPWSEARAMGSGNSLRLVAAHFLVGLVTIVLLVPVGAVVFNFFPLAELMPDPHTLAAKGTMWAGPPVVLQVVMAVLSSVLAPIEIILVCALISVTYLQLWQRTPRIHSDPNEPPEDF